MQKALRIVSRGQGCQGRDINRGKAQPMWQAWQVYASSMQPAHAQNNTKWTDRAFRASKWLMRAFVCNGILSRCCSRHPDYRTLHRCPWQTRWTGLAFEGIWHGNHARNPTHAHAYWFKNINIVWMIENMKSIMFPMRALENKRLHWRMKRSWSCCL